MTYETHHMIILDKGYTVVAPYQPYLSILISLHHHGPCYVFGSSPLPSFHLLSHQNNKKTIQKITTWILRNPNNMPKFRLSLSPEDEHSQKMVLEESTEIRAYFKFGIIWNSNGFH